MVNLGKERKDEMEVAYPTMGKRESKIQYPSVCVPITILEGKNVKLGDKISITISGIVKGIQQTEWCNDLTVEAHEGEVESEADEAEEDKRETILGGK